VGLLLALPDVRGLIEEMAAHPYWYLGRSAGFVAYGLLLGSLVLGLSVSSRVFDGLLGRAWVFELHKFLSVCVVLAAMFHALIMLPDPWADFSVRELLLPLHSDFKTGPMALGIISLYGLALVSLSFYVTRFIGQKTWRAFHYSTFGLFLGTTAHGVWTGTDSSEYAVQVFYLGSSVLVMFLTFYRILALRSAKKGTVRVGGHARVSSVET
jgi:predicted ferric reductase